MRLDALFFVVLQDQTKETFKAVCDQYIHDASVISHDGHASYSLVDADPKRQTASMIHAEGEFSRVEVDEHGNEIIVLTNAIEGVFARMKRMLGLTQR